MYTRAVCSLNWGYYRTAIDDANLYRMAKEVDPVDGSCVVPGLKSFSMDISIPPAFSLSFFIARTLIHLVISLPRDRTDILDIIADRCHALQVLSLVSIEDADPHPSRFDLTTCREVFIHHGIKNASYWLVPALTSTAHRFAHIKSFTVCAPSITLYLGEALVAVSKLSAITQLTFYTHNVILNGYTPPSRPPPVPFTSFPRLETLIVGRGLASSIQNVVRYLNGHLSALVSFKASYIRGDIANESARPLFESILDALPSYSLQVLDVTEVHFEYHREAAALHPALFHRLLSFVHLHTLVITISSAMPLDDDMLVYVGTSMPALTRLDVCCYDRFQQSSPHSFPHVTLVGLARFAAIAKHINILAVTFDGAVPTLPSHLDTALNNSRAAPASFVSPLAHLFFGPGIVGDSVLTAETLLHLFPNLQQTHIHHVRKWAKRLSICHDEFDASVWFNSRLGYWRNVAHVMRTMNTNIRDDEDDNE